MSVGSASSAQTKQEPSTQSSDRKSGLVGNKRYTREKVSQIEVTLGSPSLTRSMSGEGTPPKSILKRGSSGEGSPATKKRRVTFESSSSSSINLRGTIVIHTVPFDEQGAVSPGSRSPSSPLSSPVVKIDPKVNQPRISIKGLECVRGLPRDNQKETLLKVAAHFDALYEQWVKLPPEGSNDQINTADRIEINYRLAQCCLAGKGDAKLAQTFINNLFAIVIGKSKDQFDGEMSSAYTAIWNRFVALQARIVSDLPEIRHAVTPNSIQDGQMKLKFLIDMGYEFRKVKEFGLMVSCFEGALALSNAQQISKAFTPMAQKNIDANIEKIMFDVKKSLWEHYHREFKSIKSAHGPNSEILIPLYTKMLQLDHTSTDELKAANTQIIGALAGCYFNKKMSAKTSEERIHLLEGMVSLQSQYKQAAQTLNMQKIADELFFEYINLAERRLNASDFSVASDVFAKAWCLVDTQPSWGRDGKSVRNYLSMNGKYRFFRSFVNFASHLRVRGESVQAINILREMIVFKKTHLPELPEREFAMVQQRYEQLIQEIEAQSEMLPAAE